MTLLQRELLDQKVKELRASAKIETFNLDGSKPEALTPAPAAPASRSSVRRQGSRRCVMATSGRPVTAGPASAGDDRAAA